MTKLFKHPAQFFALAAVILGLSVLFCSLYNSLRWSGYPYEDWDEVAGYNTSLVLRGDHTTRAHFYGTIDIGKYVLGDIYYTKFDLLGLATPRIHYSNNVPDSLRDPHVFFGPNYWRPQALGAIEYVYFRGIQDRTPIFAARVVSLTLCILLFACFCLFINYHQSWASIPTILFAAFFLSPVAYVEQFYLALPNGFNGLAIGAIAALLLDYTRQPSRIVHFATSALFAITVNTKFDAVTFALPFFVAVTLAHLMNRSSTRATLLAYVECFLVFITVLWATNPYLWCDPMLQITLKQKFLAGVGIGSPPIAKNALTLNAFLDAVFFNRYFVTYQATSWLMFVPLSFAGLIIAALITGMVRIERHRTLWARISTTSIFLGLLAVAVLIPIFLSNKIYARYFLPALAVMLMGIADVCKQLFFTRRCGGFNLAAFICLTFTIIFAHNIVQLELFANTVRRELASNHGLSPRHNRSLAVGYLIEQDRQKKDHAIILIDQHSYTDLRLFWERNIEVKYINMFDYESVTEQVRASGRFAYVLYALGETQSTPDWVGKWTPENEARYQHYLSFLEKLEVEKIFQGRHMPLFDWAPVSPNDEIRIVRLPSS